jgi:hypothetical protein
MGGITNGNIPESDMVEIGRGYDRYGLWKHLLPAGTLRRWRYLVALALRKYGVVLYITAGWNAYRPLWVQRLYRTALGIWAAIPGTSSHGGLYNGRLCMAVDVANWRDLAPGDESLAWARFKALCRLAGFTVDFVTPQELWHIGDQNDIWAAPASLEVTPLPIEDNDDPEEVIMRARSKQSGAWYVFGSLGVIKIPRGAAGSANYKRAVAVNKASGGDSFPVLESIEIQDLIQTWGAMRVEFFTAMGNTAAVRKIQADVDEVLRLERAATPATKADVQRAVTDLGNELKVTLSQLALDGLGTGVARDELAALFEDAAAGLRTPVT